MRLFQSSSSLRQADPKAMSLYAVKEYLPSRKQYRVSSSHLSSSPFQGSPKRTSSSSSSPSSSSSSLPKKSLLLPNPPPYPIPSLPPSSPPPLVPLWPDPPPPHPFSFPPPPAIPPSPSHSLPPPPPVLRPGPRSSTTVSLDHSSPPEGRLRRAGLNLDIPGVRQKHSRIPRITNEDSPQPISFGSSGIVHIRTNNRFGRDKKRTFLRSYKLFSQERLLPGGTYRMDEQNNYLPESHNVDAVPKESPMPKRKESKNTSELHSDRMNITTTFETFPNYPRENWEDQLSENIPNRQSADEEEESEGNLESEFVGMELREDSTVVMQGRKGEVEEDEEREEREDQEDQQSAFSMRLNRHGKGTFSSERFISSYQLESGKDEREDAFTDATEDFSKLNEDYDNDANEDDSNDTMTTEMHHTVNLEKLEKELSKKDEESASDLLLAISILQHHMIPTLQREDGEGMTQLDNKTSDGRYASQDGLTEASNAKDNSIGDGQKGHRKGRHNYNIEIFDAMSSSTSSEDGEGEEGLPDIKDIAEERSNDTILFQPVHEVPLLPEHPSSYRWFVLVLDGNCSVIKQRMTAFVTFLKAALSSKLSIDYNDVYVPSVFCDNTFMVNISLDTNKNPQAEIKLRLLAEANTTLLEISEEIFYLEKILTKRSEEDEDQDMQPLVKKPDDVELVIYIAVGCMCVFILLSVVIVALIRVCRQEGDQLDIIGKTIPHQQLPRPFDFPIRRPNVIYSHRFSQALTPDKCASSAAHRMENAPASNGRSGIGVMAVTGSGRGSVLRYDTQFAGELMVGDEEFYSMGSPTIDDPYNDRRALVPSRRRATKVPGEDVIMEEDIVEEEEEEDLEEEDEDDDEVEEEEGDDEGAEEKMADVPQEEMHLVVEEVEEEEEEEEEEVDEEDNEEDREHCHFHRSESVRAESSSRVGKEGTDSAASKSGTSTGGREGRSGTSTGNGENAGPTTGNGGKGENIGDNTRVRQANQTKASGTAATGGEKSTAASKSENTIHTATGNTAETGSRTNDPGINKTRRPEGDVNTGSRAMKAGSRAKGLLGSRIRSRRNLLPGNEVVFTGIDNPCYNR